MAVFMAYEGTLGLAARDIMLPLMIPNSPFIMRNGADRRGHGVFPCYLGQNRLEIQLTHLLGEAPDRDELLMGLDPDVAVRKIFLENTLEFLRRHFRPENTPVRGS